MLQIEVRSKKYNCDLTLDRKVSVIIGNSGRGKTQLVKAIRDTSGGYKVKYNQNVEVIVLEDNNWKQLLTSSYDNIPLFIVDDCDFPFTKEFNEIFNSLGECYLVIIARTQYCTYKSNTSIVSAVYEMIAKGIEHRIIRIVV